MASTTSNRRVLADSAKHLERQASHSIGSPNGLVTAQSRLFVSSFELLIDDFAGEPVLLFMGLLVVELQADLQSCLRPQR